MYFINTNGEERLMSVRFGCKHQYFGFYILDKRYKDGIQWHDVPCFFRSAIICEVKTPFFVLVLSSVSSVILISSFSWVEDCRTQMFRLSSIVCFKMCCRTQMFRWLEWRGREGWMSAAPPHHNQFEQISSWSNINKYPSNTNIIG